MLDVAIIGAGPYGLSIAAHFRRRGISFRIFGRPMDSWLTRMPQGMLLKSDGFASNIYDPESAFTLKRFCAERQIEYGDTGVPVRLDTFASYGLAFGEQMVPDLENKLVAGVERSPGEYVLRLEDGEEVRARRVVVAVGITYFEYVPDHLTHLPPEFLSHSARHRDLAGLRGKKVAVIGAGASALDLAGLLGQAGAEVQLVSRRKELVFHTRPGGRPRSRWQQFRHPASGLGPGLRSRFFADFPRVFHYLPERLRLQAVQKALGPSGGWFARDMVVGRMPLWLGYTPERADVVNGMVHLQLRGESGPHELVVEHVIAATGYKVDLGRLTILNAPLRETIRAVHGAPVLSSGFESSAAGLYFAGMAAANSFGPVMRFAFGAGFAAERMTAAIGNSLARLRSTVAAGNLAAASK